MRTASIKAIALMMEAVRTSKTSMYFYETIRCYIPDGCHHHHLTVDLLAVAVCIVLFRVPMDMFRHEYQSVQPSSQPQDNFLQIHLNTSRLCHGSGWLIAGLSPRRSEFAPGSNHVGFVGNKVALGQVFLRVLLFSPVSIIPPLLHTHLSAPHKVCYRSDQAAYYHTLGPKLGASSLTRHVAGTEERSILFNLNTSFPILCQTPESPISRRG
jgi:hypothetical protein